MPFSEDAVPRSVPEVRTLGILALQGAFQEHEECFRRLPESLLRRLKIQQVRSVQELDTCDALVIPGGESTTMKIIAGTDMFMELLRSFVHGGKGSDGEVRPPRPVWGTCAGCILLSDQVVNGLAGGGGMSFKSGVNTEAKRCKYGEQVGGLAVATCRNFFGRQTESFEAALLADDPTCAEDAAGLAAFKDFPAVFIRAPAIQEVREGVRVLARVMHPSKAEEGEGSAIVAAASDHVMVTCFHPELAEDFRIHQYFVEKFVLTARG